MLESDTPRTVAVIRHLAFEDMGVFGEILGDMGWRMRVYDAGLDDLAEPLQEADLAVVLGGPIGVYETHEYPFLVDELRAIEQRLAAGLPTLGICLGAQLIASALGAKVYPGTRKEIGWDELRLTTLGHASYLSHLAGRKVLHWHGDTFDLPDGATRLASTGLYENQAFALGQNVLALQFHAEVDSRRIEPWLIGHTGELAAAGIDIRSLREQSGQYGPRLRAAAAGLLCDWLDDIDWQPHGERSASQTSLQTEHAA